MQTTPNYGLQQPEANDTVDLVTLETTNTNILDTALTPTADPTQMPSGLSGKLSQWVSWIANRIKAITGTTNWYDAPPTTLTATSSHIANTSNPHNVTAVQIGAISTSAEGTANGVATLDANKNVLLSQLGNIPVATTTTKGLVKASASITVASDGTMSATASSVGAQPALGYTPVNKSGDAMAGALNVPTLNGTNPSGAGLDIQTDGSMDVWIDRQHGGFQYKTSEKNLYVNGNKVWTAGNDGASSGLDADTVRGITLRLNNNVLQYSTDGGSTWNDMSTLLTPFAKELSVSLPTANIWTTALNISGKGKLSRCLFKAGSTQVIYLRVTIDGTVVHYSSNSGDATSSYGIEQEKNIINSYNTNAAYSRTPGGNSANGLTYPTNHPYTGGGQYCVMLDDGIPFNSSLIIETMAVSAGSTGNLSIEGGTV